MYGAEIEKHYILYGVLMFLLGVAISFLLCVRNSNNLNATIQDIKEQQHSVSNEIRNSADGVREAKDTIERASVGIVSVQGQLERSKQKAINNAREIDNLSAIIKECRGIAEENRAILEEIGN